MSTARERVAAVWRKYGATPNDAMVDDMILAVKPGHGHEARTAQRKEAREVKKRQAHEDFLRHIDFIAAQERKREEAEFQKNERIYLDRLDREGKHEEKAEYLERMRKYEECLAQMNEASK